MQEIQQPVPVQVTVATVDGSRTEHTYTIPKGLQGEERQQARKFAIDILEAISGNAPYLLLRNPIVTYRPEHIVRVEWKGPTDLINEFKGPMGFHPPA